MALVRLAASALLLWFGIILCVEPDPSLLDCFKYVHAIPSIAAGVLFLYLGRHDDADAD